MLFIWNSHPNTKILELNSEDAWYLFAKLCDEKNSQIHFFFTLVMTTLSFTFISTMCLLSSQFYVY